MRGFNEIEPGRCDKRGFLLLSSGNPITPPSHIQTIFLTITEKALTRKKEAGKGGKEDGMEGGKNGREVYDSKHAACYLWPGPQNSGGIGRWLGFLSSSGPWMTSSGRS